MAKAAISLAVVSTGGPVSRYDQGRDARLPAGGEVARPAPSLNVRTALAAVPDPFDPSGKARTLATVNRRVDILEEELANRRISESAYREGRIIQAIFERASGAKLGGSDLSGVRADPETRRELAIIYGILNAQRIQEEMDGLHHQVGSLGARMLRQVLAEGRSYRDIAGRLASERMIAKVADRFRWVLEAVADARAARGKIRA